MDNIDNTVTVLKNLFTRYEAFVRLNPRLAAELEGIIRWSSYLVATRKSPVLGELLSSGANLLQLCNDILLRQATSKLKLDFHDHAVKLRTCLSVVQSLELLSEIYMRDTYGNLGRWIIITVIQITKAAIKLTLLLVFDEGITKSQSVVPLDRLHYSEILKLQDGNEQDEQEQQQPQAGPSTSKAQTQSKSVVLKTSGRKMRTIQNSPPKGSRFLESESSNSTSAVAHLRKQRLTMLLNRYRDRKSAKLADKQLYGELLHITRPIVHLILMGSFGTQSWLAYATSLAMDVSSLQLIRTPEPLSHKQPRTPYEFNLNERIELGQRVSSLLLYMLRSPFFDRYTKQRALEGIASTADNIPIIGRFLATFVNYIPEWQKDYFRIWSE